MIVRIPSPLRSYCAERAEISVSGSTVMDVLSNLESECPGIRFRMIDEQDRIRQHIRIFLNSDQIESLQTIVKPSDTVHIICALSGG
ncbi:MAG TPA: MoaD/ThiS family protein [Planktothrix sp.]|jgi:molybdopterin converting factor small subunit